MAMQPTNFVPHVGTIDADFLNTLQNEVLNNRVALDAQTIGDTAKAQARTNIGAVSSTEVATAVEAAKPIKITISNVQMKTYNVSDNITNISKITAAHELVYHELSNPSAMGSDWTVTPGAGTIQVAGTLISGQSANLILKFELPQS